MTLQVWKSRGRYLVECGACSSRGRPVHVPVVAVLDPRGEAARQAVLASAHKMRTEFEGAIRAAVHAAKIGTVPRREASARVKKLSEDHAAALKKLIDESTDGKSAATETLAKCPWCGVAPTEPAVVEALPDDQPEPAVWLKQAVV